MWIRVIVTHAAFAPSTEVGHLRGKGWEGGIQNGTCSQGMNGRLFPSSFREISPMAS